MVFILVAGAVAAYFLFLSEDDRPNIILITVDTLRADHLGCYGYERDTSPSLDRFAQEGVVFENCFSHAPVTTPSCVSLMSGFLPHETRVLRNVPVPQSLKMLPEMLRSHRYKSYAVVSNYMMRKKKGMGQGFDVYDDSMLQEEEVREIPERIATHTTDRAVELLKTYQSGLDEKKSRLFMWIHYQDPHGPYTPPDEYARHFPIQEGDGAPKLKINSTHSGVGGIPRYQKLEGRFDFKYYMTQYDREIRFFDDQFQRLVSELKKLGLYEDSLIIFTSDHGEGMGERDYYFAHGENLHSNLIHVPLIMRFGGRLKGRRDDFVQHLDVVPTILSIMNLELDERMRGKDLRERQPKDKEIFSVMRSNLNGGKECYALIQQGFKMIFTVRDKSYELYDMKADPGELKDLALDGNYQKVFKTLKRNLKRIKNENRLKIRGLEGKYRITEEERRKMEMLGYGGR